MGPASLFWNCPQCYLRLLFLFPELSPDILRTFPCSGAATLDVPELSDSLAGEFHNSKVLYRNLSNVLRVLELNSVQVLEHSLRTGSRMFIFLKATIKKS